MKFLADMGISPKTVAFLKQLGFDAKHLHEEALDTLADSEILKKARDEHRTILTHDLDFGELVAASGEQLPSIITFRLRNMRPENVNRYLEEILSHHQTSLKNGSVISVSENKIRIRTLPIS